jgi:plastocyanin
MRRTPLLSLAAAFAIVVVAVVLPGCGGGGGGGTPTMPPPPGGEVMVVRVLDNRFDPQSITVEPGTTVRWIMRGTMPGHTVTDNGGAFDSGFVFVNDGDTFERTFPQSEEGQTFNYACQSHQACCNMQGSVRVGNSAPQPDPGY